MTHPQRFVEQTGSSTAVQKVVVLLHVAVREPLGQVETANARTLHYRTRIAQKIVGEKFWFYIFVPTQIVFSFKVTFHTDT